MIDLSHFCDVSKAQGAGGQANPSILLVGRVGIEPTTNGLRVQRTRVTGARKGKKRNGRLARERTPALRPNLCRTKSRRWGSGVVSFKPRQRLSRQRRTVPERAPSGQFLVTSKRGYCASDFEAMIMTRYAITESLRLHAAVSHTRDCLAQAEERPPNRSPTHSATADRLSDISCNGRRARADVRGRSR